MRIRIFISIVLLFCVCSSANAGKETCASHSVDIEKIQAGVAWIEKRTDYIDSFVVQHCGERLVEHYFGEYDEGQQHDLQSATKTFTGMLIGIALDQGIIDSIDHPIVDLLPEYVGLLTGDKANITVRHLLTMTSGLRWVDFGEDRSFERMAAAEDSIAFILGESLVSQPGDTWFYNTGSSHLLSGIIHYSSGMTTSAFAEKFLFGPLGFGEVEWRAHKDGVNEGGWQLYVRPGDMAKFGQMLLDNGQWEGKQIVSADYVDAATTIVNETSYGDSGYGYQMWIQTDFGTEDVAGARGWGGQDIFVLEDLHMVVVFTGSVYHPQETNEAVKKIMSKFVIPAHD